MPGKAPGSPTGSPRREADRRTHYRRCGAAGRTDLHPGGEGRHGAGVSAKGGWDRCVVVNKERIVLGLLRERELASDSEASVEDVMKSGPAMFRPKETVEKVAKRRGERETSAVLVTTLDGRLVGPPLPGRCRTPSRRVAVKRAAETLDRLLKYNQPT